MRVHLSLVPDAAYRSAGRGEGLALRARQREVGKHLLAWAAGPTTCAARATRSPCSGHGAFRLTVLRHHDSKSYQSLRRWPAW